MMFMNTMFTKFRTVKVMLLAASLVQLASASYGNGGRGSSSGESSPSRSRTGSSGTLPLVFGDAIPPTSEIDQKHIPSSTSTIKVRQWQFKLTPDANWRQPQKFNRLIADDVKKGWRFWIKDDKSKDPYSKTENHIRHSDIQRIHSDVNLQDYTYGDLEIKKAKGGFQITLTYKKEDMETNVLSHTRHVTLQLKYLDFKDDAILCKCTNAPDDRLIYYVFQSDAATITKLHRDMTWVHLKVMCETAPTDPSSVKLKNNVHITSKTSRKPTEFSFDLFYDYHKEVTADTGSNWRLHRVNDIMHLDIPRFQSINLLDAKTKYRSHPEREMKINGKIIQMASSLKLTLKGGKWITMYFRDHEEEFVNQIEEAVRLAGEQ